MELIGTGGKISAGADCDITTIWKKYECLEKWDREARTVLIYRMSKLFKLRKEQGKYAGNSNKRTKDYRAANTSEITTMGQEF